MKIESESLIAHPVEAVFEAYRDRLPEVVPYLDDIREIVVESRREGDGVVTLHNVWSSDKDIPAVASKFIKPEHLSWDDHAQWSVAETRCQWRIEPRAFQDAFRCSGTTTLIPEGDRTRVRLAGELTIDAAKVRGVPKFLAKTVGPQIEKFIVALIKPNLEKTNVAIGQFLDAQAG